MSRFTPSRTLTLVFAATALLSAAIVSTLQGKATDHAFQADTPHRVADCLDALIQPRFQDDRAGVFGVTRVVTPAQLAGVEGHYGLALLQPKTLRETVLLHLTNAAHHDYVIAFLHCAHVPGHYANTHIPANADAKPYLRLLATRPSPIAAQSQQTLTAPIGFLGPSPLGGADFAAISRQSIAALPRLRRGTYQEATVNNWLVVMRPIAAGKASCLGCHTGAKQGDTLGVMVYAVSKKPETDAR
jgi:hypothetical protein